MIKINIKICYLILFFQISSSAFSMEIIEENNNTSSSKIKNKNSLLTPRESNAAWGEKDEEEYQKQLRRITDNHSLQSYVINYNANESHTEQDLENEWEKQLQLDKSSDSMKAELQLNAIKNGRVDYIRIKNYPNHEIEEMRKLIEIEEMRKLIPIKTINQDQAVEQCVSVLLKKDPKIFSPWVSTQKISELMKIEVSSNKTSLPLDLFVEDEDGKKPLSFYVKEELNKGLDAEITVKGKHNFKKMVSSIETIPGNFWISNEITSTVPTLLKRLNEGEYDKEITGWNSLGEDYKKYVAATVLYRRSNKVFPKAYEDIEPYLKNK